MTHTPTLPNGFSRDKPELTDAYLDAATKAAINDYFSEECWEALSAGQFKAWRELVAMSCLRGDFKLGDAVLKELAEGK